MLVRDSGSPPTYNVAVTGVYDFKYPSGGSGIYLQLKLAGQVMSNIGTKTFFNGPVSGTVVQNLGIGSGMDFRLYGNFPTGTYSFEFSTKRIGPNQEGIILVDYIDFNMEYSNSNKLSNHQQPKICTWIQSTSPNDVSGIDLTKFSDVLCVDFDAFTTYSSYVGESGTFYYNNPNQVIIGATPSMECFDPTTFWFQQLPFLKNLSNTCVDFYTYSVSGVPLLFYPTNNTKVMNYGLTNAERVIADTAYTYIGNSSVFDGFFLDWAGQDNCRNYQSYSQNATADLNRDGSGESNTMMDAMWQSGLAATSNYIKTIFPDALVGGNAGWGSNPVHQNSLNAVMIEQFNLSNRSYSNKLGFIYNYQVSGIKPRYDFIMVNADNPSGTASLNLMRYGLCSALMLDCYYTFTSLNTAYNQNRVYAEYSVNSAGTATLDIAGKGWLGRPIAAPISASGVETLYEYIAQDKAHLKSWVREYQNGIAIVNPTSWTETITLPSNTYKKITELSTPSSTYYRDASFHDGSNINSITIPASGGAVLLRRSSFP